MNGRMGPLTDLTRDDVKRIREYGRMISDNHKTGHFYDEETKTHYEQFPWLERSKQESRKRNSYRGKLGFFGTSLDTKNRSLAATIRIVLFAHFHDKVLEKNITVIQFEKRGTPTFITMLTRYQPMLVLSMRFNQPIAKKLPNRIILCQKLQELTFTMTL